MFPAKQDTSPPQEERGDEIRFELKDVKPRRTGALLSSEQAVIGLCLQRYYQRLGGQGLSAHLDTLLKKLKRSTVAV